MIRASQRDQRARDVTVFVFNGAQLAVIAKPSYPPGAFRVPGGIDAAWLFGYARRFERRTGGRTQDMELVHSDPIAMRGKKLARHIAQ